MVCLGTRNISWLRIRSLGILEFPFRNTYRIGIRSAGTDRGRLLLKHFCIYLLSSDALYAKKQDQNAERAPGLEFAVAEAEA